MNFLHIATFYYSFYDCLIFSLMFEEKWIANDIACHSLEHSDMCKPET